MGEKGKKNIPTAKLELDKSMYKRTEVSNDTALESPKIWYTPPVFSNCGVTKLYYRRNEKISIDVNAICEHFEDNNLKFEWECVVLDSSGYIKRFTNSTKSPHAVISALNNIKNDHNIQISAIISDINNPTKKVNAKNCITIRPVTTPKEISDKTKWLRVMSGNAEAKENSTFDNIIHSTIEIYGYNGEDVTVNRVVILKGKVIFDNKERVIVSNNSLLVKFNRSEIINKTKNGDTVTLKYVITVNAWGDDNYKAEKRDFKIDKHTLVEGETVNISQPVVCGTIDIQENTFKQCKYRKIEAEYTKDKKGTEKEKITIFQENDSMEPLPLNLIGGKRKVNITLSEYTPNKCRLKEGSHKEHCVIYTPHGIITGSKHPISVSGKAGKSTFDLEYKYDALPPPVGNIQILKYVWPIHSSKIQQSKVLLATCRYNKNINVNLYPDIEWVLEFVFKVAASNSIVGKNLSSGTYGDSFEQAQKSGYDYSYNKKYGKTLANFGLSLNAEISDKNVKYSLSANYEKRISAFADAILKAKEVADTVLDAVKDEKSKFPFTFEIEYPKMVASLKWCAAYRPDNNLGIKGLIDFKADPLVGANFSIDLLKFGSRAFPIVGFVVDLVNSSAKTKEGTFSYEGKLELLLTFSGSLGIDMTQIEFYSNPFEISASNPKLTGKFMVNIELIIGISLGVKAFKCESKVKISANAAFDAAFSGNLKLGVDDKGVTMTPNLQFDGMTAEVTFVAEFAFKTKWIKGANIEAGKEYTFSATLWEDTKPLELSPFYLISIEK